MSSNIRIYLDNSNMSYYPGQTIAGRVECFFDKQKGLRAVSVKFRGRAKTYWTESESYYDSLEKKHKSRSVHYSAEEVYFDAQYNLVTGGDNFSLPAGTHNFPFSYILPAQLPSSYEGDHGDIRYSLTAKVNRPWKFDYEAKVVLNVNSPLDLNYLPALREPVNTSVDKHLCCLWCRSGPLTFNMSLPATGFVAGQDINVGAYVENMSNVTAEGVKFKLIQAMEFIAHCPRTKSNGSSQEVVVVRDGAIGAHSEKSWTSKLSIPQNGKYPNLSSCGIIKTSYYLSGKVVLPCPHSDLEAGFPVQVGTIPLQGVNFNPPGAPPMVSPSSDISSQIIPGGPIPGTSEVSPLVNPSAPYPNVGFSNAPPYLPEKGAYPPPDFKPPFSGDQSMVNSGATHFPFYPASAPPIQPPFPIGVPSGFPNPINAAPPPPSYDEAQHEYEKNVKGDK